MSELVVGSIAGLAANSYVVDVASGSTLDLSAGAVFPAGNVIQVVSTTKTDTFTTTSTTFTDVTGLSATITPRSTSSKILVQYHVVSSMSSANWGGFGRLMRDATPIGVADSAGSRREASTGFYIPSSNQMALPTSGAQLDSPSTTSSVTYSFQIASQNSSYSACVNRSGADTDNGDTPRMVSSITLMEIAG